VGVGKIDVEGCHVEEWRHELGIFQRRFVGFFHELSVFSPIFAILRLSAGVSDVT
jgi:hypothetical protein